MDKVPRRASEVAAIVVLGAVIAVFLFLGFFVSTRRAVAAVSERLARLRDHESRELSSALDALAGGDLTVEVACDTQPISEISRDELARSRSPPTRSWRARRRRSTATTACAASSPR